MTQKFYLSNTDKKICDVCGGLGEYFDVDPMIFRLCFIFLFCTFGTGILAYLAIALIAPRRPM